jgi:hypothetical protein
MSEEVKQDEVKQAGSKKKAVKKYYKNEKIAGLSVIWQHPKDTTLATPDDYKYARFTPYYDTYKGDRVMVGYLETDNEKLINVLSTDTSCIEIDAKEYEKATTELAKAPIRVA